LLSMSLILQRLQQTSFGLLSCSGLPLFIYISPFNTTSSQNVG
jgi:hypothetical protein